jgi:chromosome segregation ATPase
MSPKVARKRSKAVSAPRRAHKAMSPEARTAYAEIQQGLKHLEKSVAEIQRGLRKAERKLEADARARIRTLRKDARTQLAVLKSKQREAAGALKRVSAAAGGSWGDINRMVDSILVDVRATAAAAVERFRTALGA